MWGAWAYGGKLILVPSNCARSPSQFAELLREEGVTVLNQTPSAFRQLVAELDGKPRLADLRAVVFGGEMLDFRALRSWLNTYGGDKPALINMYGITEITVHATYYRIGEDDVRGNVGSIVGRPLGDLSAYILDQHGQPAPLGVFGELHIGGAGVARGYLNRPELTAARFVADPFSAVPGARMYKTGDLGRWLADGSIEYLGRNDFQVKLRGFRIELGEIEASLAGCVGVREAVVVAREEAGGDKRLVAYVVAEPGAVLAPAQLRAILAQALPEYMVPSAFVELEALPLTPNGKLDRRALPAPDREAVVARAYAAPQGAVEEALASIWQDLLGLEKVGRQDHFFELGGHSLLAVRLMAQVRERFGVELALRALFAGPTLEEVGRAVARGQAADLPPLVAQARTGPMPLSLAQQRLWFLAQLDAAAGAAYHMPSGVRLTGALDRGALRAALNRIVARHESLRTRFVSVAGEAVQEIGPAESGFVLVEQDLRACAGEEREARVAHLAQEEATQAFDLAAGPLIRGRLLQLDEDEHVLLVTQHHIVSDGWSVGVLLKEFAALYEAFCAGRDDPLPVLKVQYADYAQWQRGWLQGEQLQRQTAYWREHLRGAPALLELPTDRVRPAVPSYAGGQVAVAVPAALTRGLRELARKHETTLYTVVLAGWSALLSRLSGQQDIVVGTPFANRQWSEVEPLIGFFINTLALRVQLEAAPTVGQLLAQLKETVLAGHAHQDVPFEQVVEAANPMRSLSHSPLFQTTLTFNNTPGASDVNLPGLVLAPLAASAKTAQFDLALSLSEQDEHLIGSLNYASDLFDRSTAERYVRQLLRLLDALTEGEEQQISRLPLLSDGEREQLLVQFNATSQPFEAGLLHTLFEAQARQRPDATAVVYAGAYAELWRIEPACEPGGGSPAGAGRGS